MRLGGCEESIGKITSMSAVYSPSALAVERQEAKDSPHIFIWSNVTLGLIPSGAHISDLVCQFLEL
jgi:hypothetical protein